MSSFVSASNKRLLSLVLERQVRWLRCVNRLIGPELKQANVARARGQQTPVGPVLGGGDGQTPPAPTIREKTRQALQPLAGRVISRVRLARDPVESVRIAGAAKTSHELFMHGLRRDPTAAALQPAVPYQYRPPPAALP